MARQVRLSGRDPALVTALRDQVIAELLAELLNQVSWGENFDLGEVVWRTMTPTERETATFAPGFFRVDRPATTAAERRELLLQLLQQVTGEQA